MNFKGFKYNSNNELCCENVSLKELGEKYKTPLYVYSGESIVSSYKRLERSLSNTKTEIHFALKANSTLGILSLLSKLGSGADIVLESYNAKYHANAHYFYNKHGANFPNNSSYRHCVGSER